MEAFNSNLLRMRSFIPFPWHTLTFIHPSVIHTDGTKSPNVGPSQGIIQGFHSISVSFSSRAHTFITLHLYATLGSTRHPFVVSGCLFLKMPKLAFSFIGPLVQCEGMAEEHRVSKVWKACVHVFGSILLLLWHTSHCSKCTSLLNENLSHRMNIQIKSMNKNWDWHGIDTKKE